MSKSIQENPKSGLPAGRQGRKLSGVVVSDKMKKTVVVRIDHSRKHPKYLKYYTVSTRLKAHDEKGEYKTGDQVVIQETRPISRDKRWIVVEKMSIAEKKEEPKVAAQEGEPAWPVGRPRSSDEREE